MKTLTTIVTTLGVFGSLCAADVTGKWKSEFDTQIGDLKYVYEFKLEGDKLTGKAIGDIAGEKSATEIKDGKINGAEISFVETVKFQGQDVRAQPLVAVMVAVAGQAPTFQGHQVLAVVAAHPRADDGKQAGHAAGEARELPRMGQLERAGERLLPAQLPGRTLGRAYDGRRPPQR